MDALQSAGFIQADSRRDLVGNVLVLVGYGAGRDPASIGRDLDLAALLAGGKLSMGLLDSVPAGQYGKEALEKLGIWPSVEASVASRKSFGGTAPSNVKREAKRWLKLLEA